MGFVNIFNPRNVLINIILFIFLGKKVLDHSALLGLAAKLDFTTVKLRKTGIVEQVKYMHRMYTLIYMYVHVLLRAEHF